MKNKDLKENLGEIGGTEAKGKKKLDENKKNIILAAIIGALAGAIITTSIFLVINSNKKLNSNGRFTNDNFSQMEREFKEKGGMMERPDSIPEDMPEDERENIPSNMSENGKGNGKQRNNLNSNNQEEKQINTKNKETVDENI